MPGVCLVIPAWNEPEAIGPLLAEIPHGHVDQVLVVVGGPTDPTAAIARAHGARSLVQPRPGYGAACWTGAEVAFAEGATIIAFLDGDYADPPADLPRVLAPILAGQADLVLACRNLAHCPQALPAHAQLGNRLVLGLLHLLLGRRLGDLPSFKAIRADALRTLQMREMTYGWTVEMLVKAVRAHLRIEQVSIAYRARLGGRSKVSGDLGAALRAGLKLALCAVAYSRWRPAHPALVPDWTATSGH